MENIRNEAHLARLIHWDTVTDSEVNTQLAELGAVATQAGFSFRSGFQSRTNHEIFISVTSDNLETLRPKIPLSSNIVQAALHLANKLKNVRIGSSICMGDSQPFAQAQKELSFPRVEPNECTGTVYLFQIDHGKHGFSLLEIDNRERHIQLFVTQQDNRRIVRQLRVRVFKKCLDCLVENTKMIQKAFSFLNYGQIEVCSPAR